MNKNPFSIYDFMGYLFPGVLCYIFIFLLFRFGWHIANLIDFNQIKEALSDSNTRFDFDKSIIFIVASYILGHLVSYLSSLTIEQFAIKVFEYPSVYLLDRHQKNYVQLIKDYFATDAYSTCKFLKRIKIVLRFILKCVLLIVIFPVSFSIYFIGYLFDLNGWIVRPLDGYLIETIKKKQYKLANKLQISHPDVNDKTCDYHRIIQHYVFLNVPNSQKKTDNYIALYGFLRCISFIFCIAFLVVAAYGISTISLSAELDGHLVVVLITLYLIAYISFLGFMKFYRRFTLENYMTLLSGMYDANSNTDSI